MEEVAVGRLADLADGDHKVFAVDAFEVGVAALAFLPAFIAGAWAGEHPEIRDWPRMRLISMWVLLGLGYLGVSDYMHHWRFAAAVAAAPAAVLTLRWFELAGHSATTLPTPKTTDPRLPAARIVGTDIAHAVPLTLVGGMGYWMLGSIDWGLLGALLLGSLPGIVLGSYLATRVPELVLRTVLSATLIVVATRLLI